MDAAIIGAPSATKNADKPPRPQLLHGHERRVYGHSADASQKELIASKVAQAKDLTHERVRKRGGEIDEAKRAKNRNKSRIRAGAARSRRADPPSG